VNKNILLIIVATFLAATTHAQLSVTIEEIADINAADRGSNPQPFGVYSGDNYYFLTETEYPQDVKLFRFNTTLEDVEEINISVENNVDSAILLPDDEGGVFVSTKEYSDTFIGYISPDSTNTMYYDTSIDERNEWHNLQWNGDKLFFFGNRGEKLFIADRETTTTQLVQTASDIEFNYPNSRNYLLGLSAKEIRQSVSLDSIGNLIFAARDPDYNFYLLSHDGTESEPKIVLEDTAVLYPDSWQDQIIYLSGELRIELYVVALKLIKYDKSNKTRSVIDTNLYSYSNSGYIIHEDNLYYLKAGNTPDFNPSSIELWRHNLVTSDSVKLTTSNRISSDRLSDFSSDGLYHRNDHIFFLGSTEENGNTLLSYNLFSGNTASVFNEETENQVIAVYNIEETANGLLIHLVQAGYGESIYYVDGNPENTQILTGPITTDFTGPGLYASGYYDYLYSPNKIFDFSEDSEIALIASNESGFLYSDFSDTYGIEPFYAPNLTDGALLQNLNNSSVDSRPEDFIFFEDRFFFNATEFNTGRELWSYDPANNITEIFSDFTPDHLSSSFTHNLIHNDKLYFYRYGSDNIYMTDGNHGVVSSPFSNAGSSTISDIRETISTKDKLYMTARATNGHELFVSDGFSTPTQITAGYIRTNKDDGNNPFAKAGINSASKSDLPTTPISATNPRSLTLFDDDIYYLANDPYGASLNYLSTHDNKTSRVTTAESIHEPLDLVERHLFFTQRNNNRREYFVHTPEFRDFSAGQIISHQTFPQSPEYSNPIFLKGAEQNDHSFRDDRVLFFLDNTIYTYYPMNEDYFFSVGYPRLSIQRYINEYEDPDTSVTIYDGAEYFLNNHFSSDQFYCLVTDFEMESEIGKDEIIESHICIFDKVTDEVSVFNTGSVIPEALNFEGPRNVSASFFDSNLLFGVLTIGERYQTPLAQWYFVLDVETKDVQYTQIYANPSTEPFKISENEYLIGLDTQGNGVELSKIVINARDLNPVYGSQWMMY